MGQHGKPGERRPAVDSGTAAPEARSRRAPSSAAQATGRRAVVLRTAATGAGRAATEIHPAGADAARGGFGDRGQPLLYPASPEQQTNPRRTARRSRPCGSASAPEREAQRGLDREEPGEGRRQRRGDQQAAPTGPTTQLQSMAPLIRKYRVQRCLPRDDVGERRRSDRREEPRASRKRGSRVKGAVTSRAGSGYRSQFGHGGTSDRVVGILAPQERGRGDPGRIPVADGPGSCRAYRCQHEEARQPVPPPSETLTRQALDGGEDVAVSAASEFMLSAPVVLLLAPVPAKPISCSCRPTAPDPGPTPATGCPYRHPSGARAIAWNGCPRRRVQGHEGCLIGASHEPTARPLHRHPRLQRRGPPRAHAAKRISRYCRADRAAGGSDRRGRRESGPDQLGGRSVRGATTPRSG